MYAISHKKRRLNNFRILLYLPSHHKRHCQKKKNCNKTKHNKHEFNTIVVKFSAKSLFSAGVAKIEYTIIMPLGVFWRVNTMGSFLKFYGKWGHVRSIAGQLFWTLLTYCDSAFYKSHWPYPSIGASMTSDNHDLGRLMRCWNSNPS